MRPIAAFLDSSIAWQNLCADRKSRRRSTFGRGGEEIRRAAKRRHPLCQ